jgi:hypothetical protein
MASPKLAEAVLKATQLLDRLLSPGEADPLHPEILKHCKVQLGGTHSLWEGCASLPAHVSSPLCPRTQALQFSFQSKTGLGLSWTSGFGFSIK